MGLAGAGYVAAGYHGIWHRYGKVKELIFAAIAALVWGRRDMGSRRFGLPKKGCIASGCSSKTDLEAINGTFLHIHEKGGRRKERLRDGIGISITRKNRNKTRRQEMSSKKITMALLAVTALFFASVTFSGIAEAKMTLRMVGFLPMQHHLTATSDLFIKEVEKNTKGEVEIKHFPAMQLYNHANSVAVLQSGGVDLGLVQTGFWTGVAPTINLMAYMSFFTNAKHYWGVMDGPAGDMMRKEFEENGNVKVIGNANYGKNEVSSNKPLIKYGDFKGMRLRAAGGGYAHWVRAMGAAPVTMDAGEVYQAMQRGTIDGAVSGPSTFDERKWYEVVKYSTDSNILPAYAYWMLLSKKTWDKLTPAQQKIFMDAAQKAREYNFGQVDEVDRLAEEKIQKMGMVLNKIDPAEEASWRKAVVPRLLEDYTKMAGKEKADKIINILEEMRKKYQ
jgi:C4-dicarboxylate-binding protein DctP